MLVSSTAECPPFIANDGCLIREVLHPAKTGVPLPYSLAVAEVAPGACTRRHRLAQDEVYYLLEGVGRMHIDDQVRSVLVGDAVHIPTVPEKEIVDPTGVGDAFRGGFLAGYSRGFDWKLCGEIGSLSAVYCLEQRGTQNHSYTVQEFVQRFRQHFDDGGQLDGLLK